MGKRYKNVDYLYQKGKAGDFCISKNEDMLHLIYSFKQPVSNEDAQDIVSLPIRRVGILDSRPTVWEWNGDLDKPTLSPSILVHDRWHGFLRNGKLETA